MIPRTRSSKNVIYLVFYEDVDPIVSHILLRVMFYDYTDNLFLILGYYCYAAVAAIKPRSWVYQNY